MSNTTHLGLADKLTVVPTGASVGATRGPGGVLTPITAGVSARNVGVYCGIACTATVTFLDGTSIAAFPFVPGWHPLECLSLGTASVANALYWATQSQL